MLSAGYFGRPLRPSLTLDLRNPAGQLDSRVTFTRASAATYFGADGLLTTAVSGAPRFDFDPSTLAPRGLLIEETRTNLLQQSSALATAPWFNAGLTSIVDNTGDVLAPDGLATATKIVATGSGSSVGQGAMLTAAQHTGSVWLRAASGTMNLSLIIYVAVFPFALIGFANITATTSWQRFSVTSSAATAATYVFQIHAIPSGTLYAWGAQLEAGSSPTSYIATASATATRAADVATVATSAFPFNPAAGTLVARHAPQATSGTIPILTLDDGTANERIRLVNDSGTLKAQIVDGGVTQADISLGSISVGTTYRIALAWAANDIAACVNGGAVSTDTGATLPTVATLTFGQGWHAGLSYYPRRLSNAELQQVTA